MEGGGHRGGGGAAVSTDVLNRITKLEDEKSALQKTVSTMEKTILDLTKRLAALETGKPTAPSTKSAPVEEEEDDDEDMAAMEAEIRKIEMDGLIWGAGKLQPVGYGINKLSILCTVEDEKVSIDELSETIQELEDYVQSVDIAAFNKI